MFKLFRTSKTVLLSFLIILLLPFSLACADELIVEPEMGRAPILNAFHDANHSIDLVMYGFTDEQLLRALTRQRNKSIKIILERTPYKAESENNKTISLLDSLQMNWHGNVPPYRLVHEKTLIIDDHKAYIMTFNFTRSTFKDTRNFALVIDDPERVSAIQQIFEADWNHVAIANHHPDIILSPDDSRAKFEKAIREADHHIYIYAQCVNDYKIVGALAKAARKGVKIEILTSGSMRCKQMDYLERAGVLVRQSRRLYIHAKVMIIDNDLAIIGSTNFSRASLDDNRELSVITHDKSVIHKLNEVFMKDWDNATTGNHATQRHTSNKHYRDPEISRTLNQLAKIARHYYKQL